VIDTAFLNNCRISNCPLNSVINFGNISINIMAKFGEPYGIIKFVLDFYTGPYISHICIEWYILSCDRMVIDGLGLVIGYIEHLQIITTNS
jgi:hypothetical protein